MLALSIDPSLPGLRANRVDLVMDGSQEWDRELLQRIAKSDTEAYRALFDRYAPTALALALRLVRHRPLAEESVQEAFFEVWRGADRYEEARGSVRAWIMTLVHNRAVDALRRELAQRRRADDATAYDPPVDDPAADIAEALDIPKERARVRAALDTLPDEQRQVLELMYFDGLSQTQVADQMTIPLGTVKSRAVLAMRKLRTQLTEVER
jgi:RNA polymerase sigma-70 factor (ECF subfamily)